MFLNSAFLVEIDLKGILEMANELNNRITNICEYGSFVHFWVGGQNMPFKVFVDGVEGSEVADFSEALTGLPLESQAALTSCFEDAAKHRSATGVEFIYRSVAGKDRWFLARFLPLRPERVLCAFMDISALRVREERTGLILQEFAHRIKNTMTMVQSIARLTLKADSWDAHALQAFQARLIALAGAHDLLLRNDWQGASLGDVVREAIGPFIRQPSSIHVEGEQAIISARLAKIMILTIHELCTNAVKYGALSAPDGEVSISWRIHEEQGVSMMRLLWRETKGPVIKAPPARRGFGARMIEEVLGRQTGVASRLNFAPEGLWFELAAPLVSPEDALPQAIFDKLNDVDLTA